MGFFAIDNSGRKYATVGFARCGNVYLNRRLRAKREHEWVTQTYHSAGMASRVSAKGILTIAVLRKPDHCVLSNKVANPELSILSIYLAYMLFLLRLSMVPNIIVVDFDDVVTESEYFRTAIDRFLPGRGIDSLPSAEAVKKSILSDSPQGNNPLHFSAPTQEKEDKKAFFRAKVGSHFLLCCADAIYYRLLNNAKRV